MDRNEETTDEKPRVWVARIQDRTVDMDIIQVHASREIARRHVEEFTSVHWPEPLAEWYEDLADGNSELGITEDREYRATISRRTVETETPSETYYALEE